MGKILLVDDDPDILNILNIYLEKHGHQTFPSGDGQQALSLINQESFDAIISDIAMPGIDGIEFLKKVREKDLDVPAIIITGGPLLETAIQAVEYGAYRYIIKPLVLSELKDLVGRAVGLHSLAKLKRQALDLSGSQTKWAGDLASLEMRFEKGLRSLWVAFQPIVSLKTAGLYAYEALLRTAEPSFSSPVAFLEAAERLGRVFDVGRAIRNKVVASLDKAPPHVSVFINLHPLEIEDENLYHSESALAAIAKRVVLEITEHVSLERIRDLPTRANALRALGYRISLDDLGAGYAGLTNLANLEPEIVKLYMELIRGVDQIPTKKQVIGSILSLCMDLGIEVVCEGVETAEELRTLTNLGGNLFQGYLFAKPTREFASESKITQNPKFQL